MAKRHAEFYEAVNILKKLVPCAFPVKVSVVLSKTAPDCWGDCGLVRPKRARSDSKNYFKIRIVRDNQQVMILTLLHEWAHAKAWSYFHTHKECDDHPPEWGIAYAECFNAYIKS